MVCDLFLMPDLQRYNDVAHSYIGVKYLSVKDFDSKRSQWAEAVEQIKVMPLLLVSTDTGTQLHCIVMQWG